MRSSHVGDAPRYGRTGLRHGRDRPQHGVPRVEACCLAGRVCRDTINFIVTGERPGR